MTTRTQDVPVFLQPLCTDEYAPRTYTDKDLRVLRRAVQMLEDNSERSDASGSSMSKRQATAAGLRAINDEYGATYYDVPDAAIHDTEVTAETFDGDELVIDVQTHFLAPHSQMLNPGLDAMYSAFMPDWWSDLDQPLRRDLGQWIRNVFLDTENAVAVLTSGPGIDDSRALFNDEMAATRALVDSFAGSGRLLNHAVVHADLDYEVEAMAEWKETLHPAGWKVYTRSRIDNGGLVAGYRLDDEAFGLPFLERARALDVKLVCVHKGLSLLVDNNSPSDIGPVAAAFPDMNFVVYHSGYEFPTPAFGEGLGPAAPPEGPYCDETSDEGVNRLIKTVRDNSIPKGGNVYAELGTTWFSLIRRPDDAAHVLGKLIANFGEDNVIWGTDSVWYGPAQPLVDAFRTFQIPDEMCDRYGYEKLTPETREKILGLNAAKVYGIDVERARKQSSNDDMAWSRQLLSEYEVSGFDGVCRGFV